MNEGCPFCNSARNESRILKEGNYSFVIFSNPRLMPSHLLVIPKRHIEGNLEKLTKEEREEIFNFLAEFQNKILNKISSGCDIRQNYKPYVKNSRTHVNHMHFHLHPRELEDEFQKKVGVHSTALYRDLPAEEKKKLFKVLSD
jgi:diadenosine tetraphosphate (Ap4A) HIT family hydrolase